MVTRERLEVTLYVHCLSCFYCIHSNVRNFLLLLRLTSYTFIIIFIKYFFYVFAIKHLKCSCLLNVPPGLTLKQFLIFPTRTIHMFLMAIRNHSSYLPEEE